MLITVLTLSVFACKAQEPEYDAVYLRDNINLRGNKVTYIGEDSLPNFEQMREYVATHAPEGGGGTADPDSVYATLTATDSINVGGKWYPALIKDPGALTYSILFYDSLNARWVAKELVDVTDSAKVIKALSGGVLDTMGTISANSLAVFGTGTQLKSSLLLSENSNYIDLSSTARIRESGQFEIWGDAGNFKIKSGSENVEWNFGGGIGIGWMYSANYDGFMVRLSATESLPTLSSYADGNSGVNLKDNDIVKIVNNGIITTVFYTDSTRINNKLIVDHCFNLSPWGIAPTGPKRGDVWTNNIDGHLYYHDGSDWNQLDQQASVIGSVIQPGVTLGTTVSFSKPVTVYNEITISSNTTLTPSAVSATAGCGAVLRAIGNGTNTLSFSGFGGTGTFDNSAGAVNLITFLYDGQDFWYQINVK